jgi:hypothetical protein
MFRDPTIAGSWPALTAHLQADHRLSHWIAREPALAAVTDVGQVPALLAAGTDPSQRDTILGALVRLAAIDGGNDADAALLVVHLLSDGAVAIAHRLQDLSPDLLGLVIGELTAQIRAFPWRRRTRAFAANLLLDTKAAVLRELRPHRTRSYPFASEVLVDPLDDDHAPFLLEGAAAAPAESNARDLLDICQWAQRTGTATGTDLALLLDLAGLTPAGRRDLRGVATAWQINERTLRRRRDRTLARLRGARDQYLAACA